MIVNEYKVLEMALSHTYGDIDENSRDEMKMYQLVVNNLCEKPDTQYHFHFNRPITEFGVPSKCVRMQDNKDRFIEYAMQRCDVTRREAIAMIGFVGQEPIRTNKLHLDIGKIDGNGNLVAGLESNRGLHYVLPDSFNQMVTFARGVFADMVKETEIRKIADFIEVNHCIQHTHGIGSDEYYQQDLAVRQFVGEL